MGNLVKIKSDNPAHPKGYYIQFADRVKPEDILFDETQKQEPVKVETDKPIKRKKTR